MHAGAGYLLLGGEAQQRGPHEPDAALLMVRLVAAPPAAATAPAAPAPAAAAVPARSAQAPARAAPRYYLPEELEREPIVLRDRTAEAGIELAAPCVLQLFIDAGGRVVMVRFEGAQPAPALARQLRAAFGAIEFVPGILGGKPVPVRLRIELLPPAGGG